MRLSSSDSTRTTARASPEHCKSSLAKPSNLKRSHWMGLARMDQRLNRK